MREFFIKSFIFFIAFLLPIVPCFAKDNIKMRADVSEEFTIKNKDLPDEISFRITQAKTIPNVISIPENSLIKLEVLKAQRELRWHKGGLILCKLISYTPEEISTIPIDVSDKDIYLVIRKYEPIDKKEAWILGTEIVVMQGASFFAPGVDIGYFFLKGDIQREKHPNWFKAGVRNAYDNSIFWFPQKGKTIELDSNSQVQIRDISQKKAEKLSKKIDKRTERFERQAGHRIAKRDAKALKREMKNERKLVNCSVVEEVIESADVDKSVFAEIKEIDENVDENAK